jgi:hypothetical protein
MAAFPTYVKLGLGTSLELESGWKDDLSEGGTLHSRQFHDQQYYRIRVRWVGASGQQFNDIKAVYAAGPRDTHTDFSYYTSSPTLTLSVKFLAPPQIVVNLTRHSSIPLPLSRSPSPFPAIFLTRKSWTKPPAHL